jgi:hypothetical protein
MLETRRIADDLGSTVLAFWPNRYRLLHLVPILMTTSGRRSPQIVLA